MFRYNQSNFTQDPSDFILKLEFPTPGTVLKEWKTDATVCNVPTTFSVKCMKFTNRLIRQDLCIEALNPIRTSIHYEWQDVRDDEIKFIVLPVIPGIHLIRVTLQKKDIIGSPINLLVIEKEASLLSNLSTDNLVKKENSSSLVKTPTEGTILSRSKSYSAVRRGPPVTSTGDHQDSRIVKQPVSKGVPEPPKTIVRFSGDARKTDAVSQIIRSPMTVTTPIPKSSENVRVSGSLEFKIIKQNGVPAFSYPIGLAVSDDGVIYVADTGNRAIKVFDSSGKYSFFFQNPTGFFRPSAVIVLRDGFVLIKDDIKIYLFDSDGFLERTIGEKELKRPFGLALDRDGNVVTLDIRDGNTHVMIFELDGNLVKNSRVNIERNIGSKCRFIAPTGDNLAIVDLGMNKIYVCDFDGNVKFSFGCYGRGEGQLKDPAGIAVDQFGNFLVADSKNHRIQLFDPDGNFLCVLRLSCRLLRPSGIFLTPRNDLYVLNYWQNSLHKYKLKYITD